MGHAEAQAEHDKLKGLLEALSAIGARKEDAEFHKAEAALRGVGDAEALSNLERNLCGVRRSILGELHGIIKHFGG